jgi:nicotinamide-nucleotide amidase
MKARASRVKRNPGIETAVGRLLRRKGLTLAVAESCTGGLIGHRVTSVSGSSAYFLGGIIAYSNEVKIRELGVAASVLRREGAVSEAVARRMAAAVQARFGADVGIGVTGVAGPGGATPAKPVGLVCIAVADKQSCAARTFRFGGTRSDVKNRACAAALRMVKEQEDSDHGKETRGRKTLP